MIIFKSYSTWKHYILFLQDFVMRLSHMLVGIYSTEKNIMEVVNVFHINKEQEGRKKKQRVTKVEDAKVDIEEQERRKKIIHSREVRKVTFEHMETPNEDVVEISANEVITLSHNKNKQEKCKRTMPKDDSIPIDYEDIVDLDETHLNNKRRKSNVVDDEEFMVSYEYYNEIPKGSREIITLGVDLEDGIMKTTQNIIHH